MAFLIYIFSLAGMMFYALFRIPKMMQASICANKFDSVYLKNMVLNEKEMIGKRLLSKSQLLENDAKAQKDLH